MKIIIANNCAPFIYGGAEFLADSLKDKLIEYGHIVEVIRIPFPATLDQKILENIVACRLLDLSHADMVIALKFPVYYIRHSNKILWLLHQFRQVYDLWDTPHGFLPTPRNISIKQTIIHADNSYLKESKKIFTNSLEVSTRLKNFNNIDSTVLYPPLMDSERFYCDEYQDYIFYPSRIGSLKRQWLVVQSMKYVKSPVKLIIAGNPDTIEEAQILKRLVEEEGLTDKVEVFDRWITQDEKAKWMANCLGCTYIPVNEDSYGYVSLEAYHAKKPVITCDDSGGTLEVVEDGVTGFVVPSHAQSIAGAIDSLHENKQFAKKMGQAGYEKIMSMNISWENVISRLTS